MFDATTTQKNLNSIAGAGLVVDGHAGPKTFAALLHRAAQRSLNVATVAALSESLAERLDAQAINTPLRVRHLLAQAACETAGFTRLVESDGGDPHYFDRYEGVRMLGNTQPGDGARFKGRGLLDTTGRYNYGVLGRETGKDLVNHPELLEDPDKAVESACLFWARKGVNAAADAADIRRVTLLVNGGYNGLADRMTFYERLGVIQA